MATPQECETQHTLVLEHLTELGSVDVQSLSRRSELGQLELSPAVGHIEGLLQFVRQLEGRDLSRLPTAVLQQTAAGLNSIRALISALQEFSLDQENPTQARANLLQKIENSYDGILEPMLLPLSYTATQAADLARIESEALSHRDAIKKQLDDTTKLASDTLRDATKTLQAIKETAGEAGVAQEANHFGRARTEFAAAASSWLRATVATAAATLVASSLFLATSVLGWYAPSTTAATIQFVVSKLIVISVLSFAMVWCARNYRSSKHNEVLSKHREDALGTFRAFVEGSDDDRIKDAILLQASQAAFGGRATGFDPNEAEPATSAPLIDIVGRALPGHVES